LTSTWAISTTGNSATVTVADAASDTTTWPLLATSQTGNQSPATDAGITYDASTNILSTGQVTLDDGKLKFPAVQSASSDVNILDDYEEGAFAPIIEGLTTAGVGTYGYQRGTYTKIGNIVHIKINLNWSAHTGTGVAIIRGLPFTSANDSTDSSLSVGQNNNFTLTAGTILSASVVANTTSIVLLEQPTGGGAGSLPALDVAATLYIGGSYWV
jgi:hypothetical protein